MNSALHGVLPPPGVCADPVTLRSYASDESFAPQSAPDLIVYPQSRDDVQRIVREAARTGTPLVPVSSGPPHFRGDTVPARGGVIVDFSRMRRVIKLDPVNRCAMVEPGVTYGELIPAARAKGMRLNIPFLPRATKSVVTSRLEREPNLIPKYQYDYVDPLLTLEIVYGTGDDFRTGSACGPGTLETLKADLVNPWGPGAIDYFRIVSAAQGTLGLVTWAATKTEVLPSQQRLYFIPVEHPRQVVGALDELLRKRVLDECLVVNRVTLATMLANDWNKEFPDLLRRVPEWCAIVGIAGYKRRAEERVALYESFLKQICEAAGVALHRELPGAEDRTAEVLSLLSNAWTKSPDWKTRATGGSREIFFLSLLHEAPRLVDVMRRLAEQHGYPLDAAACYIQPVVQGRGCHCEFVLPSDPQSSSAVKRLNDFFLTASRELMNEGAFFSRPYGPWADMVYERYPEGTAALKKLKGVFDPQHILNPGKLCF